MADIKSMTLDQAKAYQKKLKAEKSPEEYSKSKEVNKVVNYIKTLTPNAEERFGTKDLGRAYEQLSSGVTERGGFTEANAENIFKYTGKYPQLEAPKSAGEVSSYLNNFQDGVYNFAGQPETREQIVQQITPDQPEPEPLNRVEEYEKLREEQGVTDLETSLVDLKAEQEAIIAETRARRQAEEGKTVSLGVIGGRVSEIERQQNERLDVINRTISNVTDQLQVSYGVIETYMNFMNLDHADAVAAYDKEFSRNLQIYNLVDEELDEQKATARANLQIYQNAITGGNIDYGSLSSDQRLLINRLELQSGLPVGFTASLKADNAGGKVLSTTTRESGGQKYADVVIQMPDGSMRVESKSLGASSSGTGGGTEKERAAATLKKRDSDMKAKLQSISGNDNNVSPDDWLKWMRTYQAQTGEDESTFVQKFSSFINMTQAPERYYGYERYYLGKKE